MVLSPERLKELFRPMLAEPPQVSQFYVEAHVVLEGIEDTTAVSFPNLASHKQPIPQNGVLVPEAHYVISDGSLGDPLTYNLQSCIAIGFHDHVRQRQLYAHVRQLSRVRNYFALFTEEFGDLSQTAMSVVPGYDQRYDNYTTMKDIMYLAKEIRPKSLVVDVSPKGFGPRSAALSTQTGEPYELGGSVIQNGTSGFSQNGVKKLPDSDEPFIIPL